MAKLYFRNREGLRLAGVLDKPKTPTKTCIILCHGLTGSKDKTKEFAAKLAKAGLAAFRFDFRSRGESQGNPVDLTAATEDDIESAFRFLTGKKYTKFGIAAFSFAAGPAASFSRKHRSGVKAIVLWAPVLDYRSFYRTYLTDDEREALRTRKAITRNGFKISKKLFVEAFKLKPWAELKKLSAPILFIHGDRDSLVSPANSVKYAKMLNARLEIIRGAQHQFRDNRRQAEQAYGAAIKFFLESL